MTFSHYPPLDLVCLCVLVQLPHLNCFTGGFTTRVVKEYFHLDIARLLCRYAVEFSVLLDV